MRNISYYLTALLTLSIITVAIGPSSSAARAPSAVTPYWSEPATLVNVASPTDLVDALISPDGAFHVLWIDDSLYPYNGRLMTRSKPVGGAWSAPVRVSAVSGSVTSASAAFDSLGTLHVVWNAMDEELLLYRAIESSGSISPITTWPACPGRSDFAKVLIAPEGPLYVTCGTSFVIRKDGESFQPIFAVNESEQLISGGDYAVGTDGLLYAVTPTADGEIVYMTTDGLTSWSTVFNVSNNLTQSAIPQIALDSVDNVYIMWQDIGGPNNEDLFFRSFVNGQWSETQNVSSLNGTSQAFDFVVSPEGAAHVVWNESGGLGTGMHYRGTTASGEWGAIISFFTFSRIPLAVSEEGMAHVLVKEDSGIKHYSRTVAGKWSSPVVVAVLANVDGAAIAVAGEDMILAAWSTNYFSGGTSRIMSAYSAPENAPTLTPTPTVTPTPTATPTPHVLYLPQINN